MSHKCLASRLGFSEFDSRGNRGGGMSREGIGCLWKYTIGDRCPPKQCNGTGYCHVQVKGKECFCTKQFFFGLRKVGYFYFCPDTFPKGGRNSKIPNVTSVSYRSWSGEIKKFVPFKIVNIWIIARTERVDK